MSRARMARLIRLMPKINSSHDSSPKALDRLARKTIVAFVITSAILSVETTRKLSSVGIIFNLGHRRIPSDTPDTNIPAKDSTTPMISPTVISAVSRSGMQRRETNTTIEKT